MSKRRRAFAALVVIAMVALISACGATASGGSGSGNAGGSGNSTAAQRAEGVKFAACMRSNGVSSFPDPGASGGLTIDAIANGTSLDTSTPVFTRAISACKNLEPPGFMGSKRSSRQQEAALKFAQCIRANGVKDFPDPVQNGPLVDTDRIPSAAEPGGMSILRAAMQKCRDVAAAAGVTR